MGGNYPTDHSTIKRRRYTPHGTNQLVHGELQSPASEYVGRIHMLVQDLAARLEGNESAELLTGSTAIQEDEFFVWFLKGERQFAIFMGQYTSTFSDFKLPHILIGNEGHIPSLAQDETEIHKIADYFIDIYNAKSQVPDVRSSAATTQALRGSKHSNARKVSSTAGAARHYYTSQDNRSSDGMKLGLGLAGSGLLIVGVFVPLVYVPFLGNINYFQNGRGDGVILLILAALAIVSTLLKKYRQLWFESLASLAILAYTYFDFQNRLTEARLQLNTDLSENPFAGLGELALAMVQMQWGWGVVFFGAILLLVTVILDMRSN